MDCKPYLGRCQAMFFIAVVLDSIGLLLFFIGIFAPISFWDFFIFSGPLILIISLGFWISWYLGNVELKSSPVEEFHPN